MSIIIKHSYISFYIWNIQLENGDLHYNYDLETKLALVMNTKVVPCDILNMFKVLLGSHNILDIGYM